MPCIPKLHPVLRAVLTAEPGTRIRFGFRRPSGEHPWQFELRESGRWAESSRSDDYDYAYDMHEVRYAYQVLVNESSSVRDDAIIALPGEEFA